VYSWHKIHKKIEDDIQAAFYEDIKDFLYEHYVNASDDIKLDLIRKIATDFGENNKKFDYSDIRTRLFQDHKDELIPLLTDEAIFKNVENVIMDYSHRKDHYFKWKWEEGIARAIFENAETLLEHSRIQRDLLHKIDRLKSQNKYLWGRLGWIPEGLENF
jgi:hypothetical protein